MRALLILVAAGTLTAAPPTLQELSPRGAQRGKSFTLYLRGEGLTQGARVVTTLPASFSRLALSKDPVAEGRMRGNGLLPLLVTIRPDTPVGFYPIRVTSDSGISNVLLFSVSDLPEIEEAEAADAKLANDSPPSSQKVTTPVLINGKLSGPDIDNYTFRATAGQKLVFEIEARRMGSAIDPAFEIYDAAGREIARNDDAPSLGVDSRLEVTFPKAGEYRVSVHDSKFSDQLLNFYRLKIGKYDFADSIYPLGGPKGTDVTLSGGNLAKPVHVKAEGAWVSVPGSMSLPLPFELTDGPELAGPLDMLPAGKTVNGRIAKPGQVDRYRLAVAPAQKWSFELTAANPGTSRLDALVTVYDAKGKKLGTADDSNGNGFDPVMTFVVPEGVQELNLAVEDLLGRGGDAYGYRLVAKQQHPDFTADLITPFVNVPAGGTARVSVLIQRRGYAGELRVRFANLPEGFVTAGGHVPVEAASQDFKNEIPGRKSAVATLTITAPADAKRQFLDLEVIAEAKTEDGVIQRYARGPGLTAAIRGDKKAFTAPWLGMKLPMAITDPPPLTVTPVTQLARFSQGFEFEMQYEVKRLGGAKGPVRVTPNFLSAVGNLRINRGQPGKNADKGSYTLTTNFATPTTTFDMAFDVQMDVDGKPVQVTSPIMEIEVVPGYEVTLARNEIEVAPGGSIEIAGSVRREPTFEGGLIKVEAADLPDHVSCAAVEVPEGQRDFKLTCSAEAAAKTGSFPIRIASVAPNTGKKTKSDYKIADLEARLSVGKSKLASK